MKNMKRQKDMTLKDERSKLVRTQYVTGEEWRNNSRKNEEMEPNKQTNKQNHPGMYVTGDGSPML